jgi:intracellular septation protein
MSGQKSFFLISFLPALAYWYLEENYPLEIALAGGLTLAVLEMVLEKIFTKEVHTLSRLNFILILVLGGISLLFKEGIWFKLQPFFTGLFLGGYLLISLRKGKSLMVEMSKINSQKMPENALIWLEKKLAYFLLFYGFFMAGVGIWFSTSTWLFFKTLGFYIASILFMIGSIIYMRKKLIR